MKLKDIYPSEVKSKKYTAEFCMCKGGKSVCEKPQRKMVSFGAEGYKDFIQYSKESENVADLHKKNYLSRHITTENWNDPVSPGALSRWILWNKPTLKASILDFKKRFNL